MAADQDDVVKAARVLIARDRQLHSKGGPLDLEIGNLIASLTLSLLEPTVQAFAFFFHEKVWERRLKKREQQALAGQALNA